MTGSLNDLLQTIDRNQQRILALHPLVDPELRQHDPALSQERPQRRQALFGMLRLPGLQSDPGGKRVMATLDTWENTRLTTLDIRGSSSVECPSSAVPERRASQVERPSSRENHRHV